MDSTTEFVLKASALVKRNSLSNSLETVATELRSRIPFIKNDQQYFCDKCNNPWMDARFTMRLRPTKISSKIRKLMNVPSENLSFYKRKLVEFYKRKKDNYLVLRCLICQNVKNNFCAKPLTSIINHVKELNNMGSKKKRRKKKKKEAFAGLKILTSLMPCKDNIKPKLADKFKVNDKNSFDLVNIRGSAEPNEDLEVKIKSEVCEFENNDCPLSGNITEGVSKVPKVDYPNRSTRVEKPDIVDLANAVLHKKPSKAKHSKNKYLKDDDDDGPKTSGAATYKPLLLVNDNNNCDNAIIKKQKIRVKEKRKKKIKFLDKLKTKSDSELKSFIKLL